MTEEVATADLEAANASLQKALQEEKDRRAREQEILKERTRATFAKIKEEYDIKAQTLTHEADEARKSCSVAEQRAAKAEASLVEVREVSERCRSKMSELEARAFSDGAELAQLRQEIQRLRASAADAFSSNEELARGRAQAENSAFKFQQEVESLKREVEEERSRARAAQSENTQLRSNLKSLERVAEQRRQYKEPLVEGQSRSPRSPKPGAPGDASAEIARLELETSRLRSILGEGGVTELRLRVGELEAKLQSAECTAAALKDSVARSAEQMQDLGMRERELQSKVDEMSVGGLGKCCHARVVLTTAVRRCIRGRRYSPLSPSELPAGVVGKGVDG